MNWDASGDPPRPPKVAFPLPGAGKHARPGARIPADLLASLDACALVERRSRDAEAAMALRAYLTAHPRRPPGGPAAKVSDARVRLRLPATDVTRLDALVGSEPAERERHLLAAIRRWVEIGSRR